MTAKNRAVMLPLLTSFAYVIMGMSFGFVVAMKMVWPSIGDFQILSFGRVRMLHTNTVLFGWLLQANLGLLYYIIPKLLHTKLYSQKLALFSWVLYNIAVLGGLSCIISGHAFFGYSGNKAIEYAEIPPPFDYIFVASWVLFGINMIRTVLQRKVRYLYVSVWYLVGTLIWTTFVYITGNLITQLPGVTGINQANLSWFYVHNAVGLVFTPLGLAIAYYLIPKQLNTPLFSHKLSLVGFWVISFVYVWTGAHHMIYGPISYWQQTVAILFSFSLIIPVVAVVTNFLGTFGQAPKGMKMKGAIAKFLYAGTIFYLLTCLQGPFQAIRMVNTYVSKTDWVVGHAHMALVGTFSFFAFAGVYYVLPRVTGRQLFSKKLADIHFWLTFLAATPFFAILWISGVIQGMMWQDQSHTFIEALRVMKPYHFVRWATGATMLAAQLIFLYNIWETLFGKPAEVPEQASDAPESTLVEGAQ